MNLICVGINMFDTEEYGGTYKGDYTLTHNVLNCKCPNNGRRYTLDIHMSFMDSPMNNKSVDSMGLAVLKCVDDFEGVNMFPYDAPMFELDDEYFIQLEKDGIVVITDSISNNVFKINNDCLFDNLVGYIKVNHSLFREVDPKVKLVSTL